ncbi:hypothetical protein J41TS2_41060 [Bacillus sonorensis]|nr:hypothetical protein J41TS2_41060 [Bacillus sonorensis]
MGYLLSQEYIWGNKKTFSSFVRSATKYMDHHNSKDKDNM